MKICPTCQASYGDEMSFCLQDGTRLPARDTSGLSNAPTEAYTVATNPADDISAANTIVSRTVSATPAPKQFRMSAVNPSNRMGCIVTVGQVSAMVLVVFGLGIGGFYYLTRSNSGLVAYNEKPAPDTSGGAPTNANMSANSANSAAYPVTTPPTTTASDNSKPIAGGVLNGKATSLPKPPYPPAARAVRASGTVSVQVLVDENGSVISANAVNGHPLLRAAAVSAAISAKFNPTLLSGKPVKVSGVLTFEFAP